MVNWNVIIGGTTITDIFDVNYSEGETDRLGKAVIECADNSNNRRVSSGEEVVIQKNGTDDFSGYVTGKPTSAGSDPTLEIECKDKRLELKYEQVTRVFYQMDTGDIIKEALNKTIEAQSKRYIHTGDELTNWTSNVHELELGSIASQNLHNVGTDFIFVGWNSGAGSDTDYYKVTHNDVPSRAIPGDGTIDRFTTRLLVNNRGDQFDVEVDLRDNYGNNYIWKIDARGGEFETYELKAEEAVGNASIGEKVTTDGTLEYRFNISGELAESRAAAIDFASTVPFRTISRGTTLDGSNIEKTGRTITRRVDRSIFELIKELATEDGYISYTDTNDNLYYEHSGQNVSSLDIDYNNTAVVDAEFNRDYENVINKVIVQGSGEVRATLEDSASIDFYGVSSREEPIIDEAIQTRDEAVKRGRGFLKKHAWAEKAFTFEIANSDYRSASIGDDIYVNWPPENINGTFTITDVQTDKHGIVSVSLTDSDSI